MTKKAKNKKADVEKTSDTNTRAPPTSPRKRPKRKRKEAPSAKEAVVSVPSATTGERRENAQPFPDWQQPHTAIMRGFVPYQGVAIRRALADLHTICVYAEMVVESVRVSASSDADDV